MDNNRLRHIPASIASCGRLKTLHLNFNDLRSFPEAILSLPSVENLQLKGNQIRKVPAAISKLINLERIELEGNPMENPPIQITSSRQLNPIQRFAVNSQYRDEKILDKMMQYVSVKCPIEGFAPVVSRLKLPHHKVRDVTMNKALLEHEQLLILFKMWRKTNAARLSGNEAQKRFVHLIDLADLRSIVHRLNVMHLHASLITL